MTAPTSSQLIPGISRLSRSQAYRKRGLWKKVKEPAPAPKAPEPTTKVVKMKGGKNGATRTVPLKKAPKFYPADDIAQPKKSRKTVGKVPLRGSITPGSVLILLSGRFRGKRVVFLKQLESGLLLVSGPMKINGVPLRRVNQAYVIATSTKVDISKIKLDAKFNDSYFKVAKSQKVKPTAEALFGEGREKSQVDPARVADQKAVDAQLLAAVKKVPSLKAYLNASFALSKGEFPHELKF